MRSASACQRCAIVSAGITEILDQNVAPQGPPLHYPEESPAVALFLKTHPEFGEVEGTREVPDWAKGQR
ncbi:MAG TPA: hypothetical protein VKP69_10905 [Isosphaeraceae bacterium]|nr:hypothetical protein [Isosphaeraceae bacterium]